MHQPKALNLYREILIMLSLCVYNNLYYHDIFIPTNRLKKNF